MGLDTTHGAFHGAYSAFNNFRRFLCKSIGGSFPPHDDKELLDGYWYFGEGYSTESHPGLTEFFKHEDCEGEIDPEMCKIVADELEDILPKVEELARTEPSYGHILRDGGWLAATQRFINGCRLAYERNEPLEFR